MLEKIAPSLIAGVPVIVKPATVSAYLTQAVVEEIVASKLLPEGAIQLICGGVGDLLDHLNEQDVVTFTGSATTGKNYAATLILLTTAFPLTWKQIRLTVLFWVKVSV